MTMTRDLLEEMILGKSIVKDEDGNTFFLENNPEDSSESVNSMKRNYVSDETEEKKHNEKVIDEYLNKLVNLEGFEKHPYLDTKGLITLGVGHMIPTEKKFKEIAWVNKDNTPATKEQINLAYNKLKSYKCIQAESCNNTAASYEAKTNIYLPKGKAEEIFKNDLLPKYDTLVKIVPNFEKMPVEMQMAILDLSYNYGFNMPRLIEAAKANNFKQICDEELSISTDKITSKNVKNYIMERNNYKRNLCLRGLERLNKRY
ncbi:MAG: hypothetical protein PHI50_02665 [Alphaproteobacteria bacterium]|nr:hypothetical protein [Alphaproteobacteria bacterium]